jgi:ABC-type transport system substrate-binding protein
MKGSRHMVKPLSRRDFLKLAGATAAIGPKALFGVPAFAQGTKSLTIGINALTESLDAHTSLGPSNVGNRVYGLMFDGLMQSGRDGQPQSLLATAWKNDGSTWRFTPRPDHLMPR